VPLGAGQDVGRSCIIVSIGNKNVMFDCGMHMGYNDDRRYPDFSFISKVGNYTQLIDCVIISHFHLDHCGSLPYFTEMCGFDGPIYMTYPTKAICPILLEDYRRIMVEKKGETNFFTSQMIKSCMKKVISVNVHQTIRVDSDLEIKAYYAGHVLGAAMFLIRVREESVVYTGDYNMAPDRHLGAAWIDKVRPDLLITETTYATTIRDSKRQREREFLKNVHSCVEKGGKVLIPVFALGRAQELCILLDTYWEQMNLNIPIYFSAGLTEKANLYYKLFINWTNEKIKKTFVKRNMFDFKHIKPFERALIDSAGPMVLFATPGMLHAGLSLEVFKKWAPDEMNMCILPGYCVVGTVGNKLMAGQRGPVTIDNKTVIDVKCSVKSLSFSAHADAKGIMQLIKLCEPKNVLLVHGEKLKMEFLKEKIIQKFQLPCFSPPNGNTTYINTSQSIPIHISTELVKRKIEQALKNRQESDGYLPKNMGNDFDNAPNIDPPWKRFRGTGLDRIELDGILIMQASQDSRVQTLSSRFRLLESSEALDQLGLERHAMKLTESFLVPSNIDIASPDGFLGDLYRTLSKLLEDYPLVFSRDLRMIHIRSLSIVLKEGHKLVLSWSFEDESMASYVCSIIRQMIAGEVMSELEKIH